MYTNNYYYKLICETLLGEEIEGHHPDIYYLELILGTYGVTYETVKCKGKYLKDWYIALTGATVTSSHPNVYYLRLIANYLTSQTLPWRTENYYLRLISENIEPSITVQLSASATTLTVGNSTTLTVTVLDESSDPIEDASVTIYNGETSIRTDTTDENGQIEYSYTPSSVGTFELSAVYDGTTSNIVSLTVNKIIPSLSITTTDNTINVGDAPSMSGVLSTEESYKDSSQTALATVTTSTGGAWEYTDSATTSSGTISYYAVYDGDSTHTDCTSSLLNIGVYKVNTTLNITPPSVLLDEAFDVEGNLTDASSNAISGATVTLTWTVGGVSHTATETTDSNGDVVFHSSAPTTVTTYTFQLSYGGSNKYNTSQSSEIEVQMSKVSTNITLTSPINNSRYTPTEQFTVSGCLQDTNGNDLSGKTIKISSGNTLLDTETTDSNGEFSTTGYAGALPSTGSNTITVTFEGDNDYNSSTSTRTVIVGTYQLSLTEANNKTILSEADSDTATLQATLTQGGIAVPNQVVTFFIGEDIIGSDTTDNNGVAEYTYTSQGVGDIGFKASYSSILSSTYTIEDIYKYVSGKSATPISSSITSYSLNPMSSVTPTFSSDGTNIVIQSPNSSNGVQRGDLSFLDGLNNFKISMIVVTPSLLGFQANNGTYLYGFTSESRWLDTRCNDMYWATTSLATLDSSKEYKLEMVVTGSNVSLKIYDGTTVVIDTSKTMTAQMNKFGLTWAKNTTSKFRDLRIEEIHQISLSASSDIISYADSESTTLTATHSDGTGKTVKLYKMLGSTPNPSTDTLVGTMTDNTDGTYSYTYSSTGSGDINFYATDNTLVSETYTIHDKWYYTTTLPSRSSESIGGAYYKEIFNSAIDLPSAFEIEFKMQTGSSGDRMVTLIVGESSSNFYYNGTNNTNLLSAISRNNSRAVLGQEQNVIPTGSVITVTLGYNSGVHTVKYGSTTLTVSNSEYTPSKLLGFLITKNNSSVSEIAVNKL